MKSLVQQKKAASKRSLNCNSHNTKHDELSSRGKKPAVPRSKSLEQILDSNSSSSRSSGGEPNYNGGDIKTGNRDCIVTQSPNYWISQGSAGFNRHNMINGNKLNNTDTQNRLANKPITYSASMKKSASFHDILDDTNNHLLYDDVIRPNGSKTIAPTRIAKTSFDEVNGSPYTQYSETNMINRNASNGDLCDMGPNQNTNTNTFVSNYCTIDNRRMKYRGGLAKRQQERERLQYEFQQSPSSSSNSSKAQKTAANMTRSQEPSTVIWSPPKPPRKSLPPSKLIQHSTQPSH